ncbi:MAG TPA: ArsR family transcriptional regulator [Candidatus Limnocylindrales bacterium]|nr:ArsR family transcriptional regulator [Candidatus Limnocylindrales bacterium]
MAGGPAGNSGSGHLPEHLEGHAPSLRRELVLAIRTAGPSSPDQLASLVGASRTGVLQQLRVLENEGLVSRRTERHGVGRPRHLYDVTPSAQQLFPANYDGLASGLIAAIDAIGGRDLVERVFETRRSQAAERIQRRLDESPGPDAPFFERVRELAVIQDEQGYLCAAELSADGTIRLREHNCAIFHVAEGDMAACEAELALFRDVLGADVVRETHIASGDRCCTYRINARPD